jgi:tetraacyldisaccharide 4'-kinase
MKFKKPKFWNLEKPNLISYLLKIFTIPIIINNFLLKFKTKKKINNIKTICIGNIYIGGTGKTPTSIKLYEILNKFDFNVATAKKYYSSQIDEQILLKSKTNYISADTRINIIHKALMTEYNLIIFDDGLQDKGVFYDIQFVCFDAENWIGNGELIPAGPLREKLSSLKKYDAVFLKVNNRRKENIEELIKKNNPNIKIFNTRYKPINLQKFNSKKKYLIFSGIGTPQDFKKILQKNNINVIDELIYPDHFNYKKRDIENIKESAKRIGAEIITTEKDYVKISNEDRNSINFLEVALEIDNEEELIKFIKAKIYD